MAKGQKLSRAELHELVWTQPMKDLPEVVGVSSTSVKNACRKYDIPVPDRGHWAKLKAGKSARRIPLPPRSPGMADRFVLGGNGYDQRYGFRYDPEAPLLAAPTFAPTIEEVRAAVAKKIGRVTVPRSKHAWHHVIQRLFAADDKRRAKIAESRWAYSWDKPLFDNPFEQRRLRILNALLLGVAKCGGKPNISGKEAVELTITVHQQHVPVKLLATSALKRRNGYVSTDTPLTAKEPLTLLVPSYQRSDDIRAAWADTENEKLEGRLTEIAAELVVLAEVLHREGAERHHAWLVERKADHERRLAEETAARAEAIRLRDERFVAAKREMLIGHARDLDHARTLRRLVEDVLEHKGAEAGPDVAAWAAFVRAEAHRLDPLNDDRFLQVMALTPEMFERSGD